MISPVVSMIFVQKKGVENDIFFFILQAQKLKRPLSHFAILRRSSKVSLRSWECWDTPASLSACQLGNMMWRAKCLR